MSQKRGKNGKREEQTNDFFDRLVIPEISYGTLSRKIPFLCPTNIFRRFMLNLNRAHITIFHLKKKLKKLFFRVFFIYFSKMMKLEFF